MEQVQFTEDIFKKALYIHSNEAIVKRAHDLAKTYGLAGMDAGQSAYADCPGVVPTAQLHTISHGVSAQAETPTQNRGAVLRRIPGSLLKVISLHEEAGLDGNPGQGGA
jgi:hypothetical protein